MSVLTWADRGLTLILALSCVALVVAGSKLSAVRSQALQPSNQHSIGVQVGTSQAEGAQAPPWFDENDKRNILLITLSSTCSYCDQSSSALRSLITRLSKSARVVVIGAEPAAQLSTYSARHGLVFDSAHGMSATSPYVQWSPRIFLLTSRNALIGEWSGRVDMATAESVLDVTGRATLVKGSIK
jgi:hypothetical protein